MNYYFLFFSIYAFLITPITLHASLRLGKRAGYRIRIQAAGLPFIRKADEESPGDERPLNETEVAETLISSDTALLRAAFNRRVRRQIAQALHLESLFIRARFSFEDASATALCYAAANTFFSTLALCRLAPSSFAAHIDADFSGSGTELLIQGIASARLGSLGLAAILFGAAFARARSKQAQSEEESYAASH